LISHAKAQSRKGARQERGSASRLCAFARENLVKLFLMDYLAGAANVTHRFLLRVFE
jgi:hypothetical protein